MADPERVGSEVVICPTSRNGSDGTLWLVICAWVRLSWSIESIRCTVPGAAGGGLVHGTGAERAQSTLMVAGSNSKRCMPRRIRSGSSS